MPEKRGLALALLALLLLTSAAFARERHQRGGDTATPGQFDFYVLSLSWSPSFCEGAASRRNGKNEQCDGRRPYAFVVHGLWPQFERGFPQNCQRPAPWIDRQLIRSMLDIMPAHGLVLHEWRTHGTCSGLSASRYFETVRRASEQVKIPPRFIRLNDYTMVSPDEVERSFIDANPGLASNMIAVTCDSRHLREVRVCLSKDLAFRPCPETDRRACRNSRVVMPPVRGGR